MAKKAKRGRPVSEDISEAQRKALAGIRDFTNRKGYPPTMAELGEMLEITAASVHQLINQLERKGYVKREARKARSLAVTREARREPERLVAIPLLGKVKGGPAMLAEENILGEVLVDSSLAGRGVCFGLTVDGDSMSGAQIHDGDTIIVRYQQVAETGDIVVALLGTDATVKRLYVRDDTMELRAENKRYRPIPITPDVDFRIVGKVIAIKSKQKE